MLSDYCQYAAGPLVRGLYSTQQNGIVINVTATMPDGSVSTKPQVLIENQLLGLPRLRLLRVRNDSCAVHVDFRSFTNVCYSVYSADSEDHSPFGPGNTTA
jgi:hypothetical protein